MTPIRRVFVTPEIFPFTPGGIGRVIANVLVTMSAEARAETLVLLVDVELPQARWRALYPDVTLVTVTEDAYRLRDARGRRFAPKWAYPHPHHFRSVLVCQALLDLVASHPTIRHVELPDWGGMAFAATQEKKLGLAFADVTLSVRLHSTDTILATHGEHGEDPAPQAVFDVERKALADCDQIVAQLPSIAKPVAEVFAFDERSFRDRLVVHAPPVTLDGAPRAAGTLAPDLDTPLVFSSKLQRFKRPALFVRGAVGLMQTVPSYRGDAYLVAHGASGPAADVLRKLIPPELARRFHFIGDASGAERAAIVARSVCVFPGVFESFCLAAYEASLLGAYPVLNASNPGFGDDATPWTEGVCCAKFDGSLADLVTTLAKAVLDPEPLRPVVPPADPAPWDLPPRARCARPITRRERPRLSVVIPHFDLGRYLLRTVESVVASSHQNLEVIVVDDASTDAYSRHVVDALERASGPDLRVVRNAFNRGLSGARNVGLAAATGEYVACVDADDLVAPTFFRLAIDALERAPDHDFVVPQTAFFDDDDDDDDDNEEEHDVLAATSFADYAMFVGDAFATGLFHNRFSTATCVVRRETLCALTYREELESFEDWDLYARALAAGHRFLVTNTIEFLYRRRADSMIHSPSARLREGLHRHDLRRRRSLDADGVRLPLHLLERAPRISAPSAPSAPEPAPLTRKRRKLFRDPAAFFADSRAPLVRGIGVFVEPLIPSEHAWRRLAKLERDPVAFFADAKAPLVRTIGSALARRLGARTPRTEGTSR